jgi:hypothetical protein
MNSRLSFSGHETFICKHFWPKKGIDFLIDGNKFTDEDAVVKLGVGKNMVSSIRFWLKAIGLVDDDENPTELANLIFPDNGFDPYLEDIGTIWLLHYHLVTTSKASIYNLVFNDLSKERVDFTKDNLHNFLKRVTVDRQANTYNEKTFNSDISVFVRNYVKPSEDSSRISIEDEFIGLFLDIDLIGRRKQTDIDRKVSEFYTIERSERNNIPKEIFLYSILNNNYGNSISFKELVSGNNSVGNVFLINRDGIYEKIEELVDSNYGISFSQSAGNQVLHFSKPLNKIEILRSYYED